MIRPLIALLLLPLATAPSRATDFDHDHAALTRVLSGVVQGDRVDYRALVRDPSDLRAYLASLEALPADALRDWTRAERFAFWINVYNAYTLDLVVRHHPVDSIKDIGGLLQSVWKRPFVPLGHLVGEPGEQLTLDRIEHGILRPRFEDARVHAAVNCASVSCPPLRAEAFRAGDLERQLDEQVRAWLSDGARNRLERGKPLRVSRIFDWFREDFVREAGSVPAWLARHTTGELSTWLAAEPERELHFLDYDWSLNEVPRKP